MVGPELRKGLSDCGQGFDSRDARITATGTSIRFVAAVEVGVRRDTARVATRLKTTVEDEAGATGDGGRLGVPANVSVNVAGYSFDFPSIEAEKPVRLMPCL